MKKDTKHKLNIGAHVVGTVSFFTLVLFSGYVATTQGASETPSQVRSELVKDSTKLPKGKVTAEIKEIKKVPLYGYAYNIGKGMYVVNFNKLPYDVGDKMTFRVTGAVSAGSGFLLNADFE